MSDLIAEYLKNIQFKKEEEEQKSARRIVTVELCD